METFECYNTNIKKTDMLLKPVVKLCMSRFNHAVCIVFLKIFTLPVYITHYLYTYCITCSKRLT